MTVCAQRCYLIVNSDSIDFFGMLPNLQQLLQYILRSWGVSCVALFIFEGTAIFHRCQITKGIKL